MRGHRSVRSGSSRLLLPAILPWGDTAPIIVGGKDRKWRAGQLCFRRTELAGIFTCDSNGTARRFLVLHGFDGNKDGGGDRRKMLAGSATRRCGSTAAAAAARRARARHLQGSRSGTRGARCRSSLPPNIDPSVSAWRVSARRLCAALSAGVDRRVAPKHFLRRGWGDGAKKFRKQRASRAEEVHCNDEGKAPQARGKPIACRLRHRPIPRASRRSRRTRARLGFRSGGGNHVRVQRKRGRREDRTAACCCCIPRATR